MAKPKSSYLGTGGAAKAAKVIKKSQKVKRKRLDKIMESMPNTSNK